MKLRFFAALLVAALSAQLLAGCGVSAVSDPQPSAPAPVLQTIPTEPVPLAPAPAAPVVTVPTPPVTEPVPPVTEPAPAPSRPASVYNSLISKDQATAIALEDAGFTADQVTRLRAEFDYDDGRPEYEVEFHQGGYEYDYEIHAESGKIISRDKDRND